MLTISIILIIVSILLTIWALCCILHTHKVNKDVDKQNKQLQLEQNKLIKNLDLIKKEFFQENNNYRDIKQNVLIAQKELINTRNQLNDIQNNIMKTLDNQKKLSEDAFNEYCKLLDQKYKEEEKEYDNHIDIMKESYSNLQLQLISEIDEIKSDLDKIKATRVSAIQAQIREKRIEEELHFYCLNISESDIKDIGILETVAPKLSKPRILWMLIWQTFFRTSMTNLCNNIIGTTAKSGIYKITNIKTKECYIGQAMDLASRWKEHAKCGLNIDTPAGNKLYKAMQEYGIWNFSWEVLEEVPPALLNEKERYYIDLYDSKNFGYNSNKGVQ